MPPSRCPSFSARPIAVSSNVLSVSKEPTTRSSNMPSLQPTISQMPILLPLVDIEPLHTVLKRTSPGSASKLHNPNTNQHRAMYWLYYDVEGNLDNCERVQL